MFSATIYKKNNFCFPAHRVPSEKVASLKGKKCFQGWPLFRWNTFTKTILTDLLRLEDYHFHNVSLYAADGADRLQCVKGLINSSNTMDTMSKSTLL